MNVTDFIFAFCASMTMQNYCTAVDMCNLKSKKKDCISNKSQRTGTAEVVYGFKVGDERFC